MVRRSWAFLIVAALAVTACEGPEGPAGPTGPMGPEGPQGPAGDTGPAGQDANENCTQCHKDNSGLFARQVQYGASTHRNGGNFERATTSCAPCHTHEGFLERIASGEQTTDADILNPSPVNCRTCHQIHTTYTDSDYALTSTDPVVLWNAGHGTVDFGAAAGNLCAQCHQGRVLTMPVIGGGDYQVTSSRYGYHHGPQAQVVGGVGAVAFTGTATIGGGPSDHGDPAENEGACATCHMAAPYGAQAGGHTWFMTYLYHGGTEENIAGCKTCHESLTGFDHLGNVPAAVQALLDDIETELLRLGIKAAQGTNYAVVGTYDSDLVGAFLNWQMFTEDRSKGLHNPPYARSVLTNTLAVLEAMPTP